MIRIDIGLEYIYVKYSFDLKVLAIVSEFANKSFNAKNSSWQLSISSYARLLQRLDESYLKYEVFGEVIEVKTDYVTTELFQHQKDFIVQMENRDVIFLGDEQGLGKSLSSLALAIKRKVELGHKHCLIIAGVNGLRYNWRAEIENHTTEKCVILGQRVLKQGPNKGKLREGSTLERIADLKRVPEEYFWITNIETFRDKKFSTTVRDLCRKGIISISIADEIHRCGRNPSLQRTGFLKIESADKIALTGTPLLNSPLDIFIILKWLSIEEHSWTDFKNYHCIFGGFANGDLLGYKNLDEVRSKLNSCMIRRLKSDVLNLPEKLYTNEYVVMGAAQQAIYDEVLNSIRTNIDKIRLMPNPLTMLIRLRQATGHTGILSSTINESIKFQRAFQIIEEVVENGGSVVVFSGFREIIDRFYLNSAQYNPAIVTGEIKGEPRQLQIDKFQKDSSCRLIVGTTGALGTGYTLTKAQTVIELDQPWNRATEDQQTDRVHRIGTTGVVNIIRLLCVNTIDLKIADVVEKKGQLSDMLVDGKIVPGYTGALLEYLLS